MHRERADLQLDRLALGPDDRRVQRLVHVELGHRDVVLEPPGHGVPSRVHAAQHGVAVADRVDEDADADQVVDVGEVAAAQDHLLVDRVVVLGPAGHRRADLGAAQVAGHVVDHGAEVLVTAGRTVGDQPHDLVVDLGVERREREVLELPLDGVHAEPVRERCVDLQRLAGLLLLLLGAQVAQRAHVVEPVGELDDQHPDVAGHRDDHLAHGLGLRGLAVLDLVELGHPVHQVGDLVAEVAPEIRQRVRRVLDRVVQQGRAQGRGRHAQLGEDRGDGERVGDERVAALAELAAVMRLGDVVGALHQAQVGLGVGRADDAEERLEHRVDAAALRPQPGQAGPHASRRRWGRYVGGRRVVRSSGRVYRIVNRLGGGAPNLVVAVGVDRTRGGGISHEHTPAGVGDLWSTPVYRAVCIPAVLKRSTACAAAVRRRGIVAHVRAGRTAPSAPRARPRPPPARRTRSIVASTVPPVASTSSTIRTRSPASKASAATSRVASPYSSA